MNNVMKMENKMIISEVENILKELLEVLSCPQPIYRWISGKILPSVNHLYALSKILGVPMEDIIVEKCNCIGSVECVWDFNKDSNHRLISYYKKIVA